MDDPRRWRTLAGLAATWTAAAVVWGGLSVAAAPGAICVLLLVCAASPEITSGLMQRLRNSSGSSLRTAIILAGAMLLWQVVGVELAMLAAGEVLAYLELLAAVSLIAVNARLKPLKTLVVRRLGRWRTGAATRFARAARASRAIRPPRFGSPPADDEDRAGALAFA